VHDKTGLAGKYDINLSWTSPSMPAAPVPRSDAKGQSAVRPSDANLQTGLQQQLGLKLEPHVGPVDLLIIDHAERPPQTALP
jgi:uncharacterized protein (TIGR03435 family)